MPKRGSHAQDNTVQRAAPIGLGLPAFAQEAAPAAPARTPAPPNAMVYFLSPAQRQRSARRSRFASACAEWAWSAGVTNPPGHLLVDVDTLPPTTAGSRTTRLIGTSVSATTETELTLPPGQHTLQLVLGDALHIPHQPPVAPRRSITVQRLRPVRMKFVATSSTPLGNTPLYQAAAGVRAHGLHDPRLRP